MTFAAKRSCGKGRKMAKQRGKKRAGNSKAVDKRATGRHERNKKIWGAVIGIAAVLLITGIGCAAFFLKSGKTPEETLVAYGELVNQRKYDRMYEMLSEQARERISEEEFTERNQKIYEGIEAENLTVQCEEEPVFEKGKKEAELSYTCEMESMAGKISFVNKSTFVKERGDWKINWDSTFIFPMLKEDYRVQINTRPAVRGNIYDRNGKLIAGNKVSYSVSIEDNGTYNTTKERILSLNAELYRLGKLIRENGDSIDTSTFPIEVDENGTFVFTGEEGTTRDRFRADIYGEKKIDDMTDEQKSSSAETLMAFLSGPDGFGLDEYSDDERYAYTADDFEQYGLPYQTDDSGKAVLSLSNQERLEILVVRYKMKQTNYSDCRK